MADDPVRDFLGTEDGEWVIVNGDFAFAAGAAAVPQGIRIRLGLIKGECYLNEDAGVDYFAIMEKNADPLFVRSELEQAIADTPDVTNVVSAQLVGPDANREASISYVADTIYSDAPFSAQVGTP